MIRDAYPNLQIIAGNVATGEGTRALIEAGANVNTKDKNGKTMLIATVEKSNTAQTAELIKKIEF